MIKNTCIRKLYLHKYYTQYITRYYLINNFSDREKRVRDQIVKKYVLDANHANNKYVLRFKDI